MFLLSRVFHQFNIQAQEFNLLAVGKYQIHGDMGTISLNLELLSLSLAELLKGRILGSRIPDNFWGNSDIFDWDR